MSKESKANEFINMYLEKYGREPSYHEVVKHVTQEVESERDSALKMLEEMAGAIQRTGTAWQNLDTDFRPHMDNLKTLLMKYNQWKEAMK